MSKVHGAMNYIGSVAKFTRTPSGFIHFARDRSMNYRKMKGISSMDFEAVGINLYTDVIISEFVDITLRLDNKWPRNSVVCEHQYAGRPTKHNSGNRHR